MSDLKKDKQKAAMDAFSAKVQAARKEFAERQNAPPDPAYADMSLFRPDPAYSPKPWNAPKKVNNWKPEAPRQKWYNGFEP